MPMNMMIVTDLDDDDDMGNPFIVDSGSDDTDDDVDEEDDEMDEEYDDISSWSLSS